MYILAKILLIMVICIIGLNVLMGLPVLVLAAAQIIKAIKKRLGK